MNKAAQRSIAKESNTDPDGLLFRLAYPPNRRQYDKALQELRNASSGSIVIASFSFDIAQWMTGNFPDETEIESSDADPETIRQFFRAVLPRTEFENISSGDLSLVKRIRLLKGNAKGSLLGWLIRCLAAHPLPTRVKESIFHSLQLFIRWKISPDHYRRLFLPGDKSIPFFHSNLFRKPSLKKIIGEIIPKPRHLSTGKKIQLIHSARATLALLYRETEPFTYADPREITCFELERGLTIVLYGMDPERRLSIESYIGYLAFKNGIPVAYGGGWIFGSRCQFGINILPAFRGGESAWLFCQLLQVYRHYFRVTRFVVKPYQFGKNNPEAIVSGAFWFYHKAGFRPEDPGLQKLAREEWKKKKKTEGYRTPPDRLKKFTGSNLVLDLSPRPNPKMDASEISKKITGFINGQFNGNRTKAMNQSAEKSKKELGLRSFTGWNTHEIQAFREWSLLQQATLKVDLWNRNERKQLLTLIKAKGSAPERKFILRLQKHRRFWDDLLSYACK